MTTQEIIKKVVIQFLRRRKKGWKVRPFKDNEYVAVGISTRATVRIQDLFVWDGGSEFTSSRVVLVAYRESHRDLFFFNEKCFDYVSGLPEGRGYVLVVRDVGDGTAYVLLASASRLLRDLRDRSVTDVTLGRSNTTMVEVKLQWDGWRRGKSRVVYDKVVRKKAQKEESRLI